MKRFLTVTLFAALFICASGCASDGGRTAASENPRAAADNPTASGNTQMPSIPPESENAAIEEWRAPDNTFKTWFNSDKPEDSAGNDTDIRAIHVGKTSSGGDIFAFLRMPMRATWLANEIKSASLKLKPSEGSEAPERLRIGYVESAYGTFITRAKASGMVDLSSLSTVDVIAGEDGWISVDVTGFVKGWLSGEVPNYGFAIFGDEEGEFLFEAVDWTENGESFPYPYLEVSGAVGERVSGYGKFGYTEAPLPGAAADQGGNCLAYALRDTNMILADDLEINLGETNKIYSESGEDGVAEYAAGLVEKYVEAHKDGLKVSGFRRIDDFDSPIDASKEYRIAFRVGCKVYEGFEVDLSEEGAFDFHLWVQLNDGRWAQKFPLDPSEIVPGSGAGVSPAKYPWDSALMWLEKFQGYYTSKVIYYAVVKDAEGLTQHKSM